MGRHTIPANRLTGGLLLGAAASGALALASLSGAGSANADCVSVSGVSALNTTRDRVVTLAPAKRARRKPMPATMKIGRMSDAKMERKI